MTDTEELEDVRESWERTVDMDLVIPRVVEIYESGEPMPIGLASVLSQGVDESMARDKDTVANFAVTAALMLTVSVTMMMTPPDGLGTPGESTACLIFTVTQVVASMLFVEAISASIHIVSMWNTWLNCDADVFLYHLELDWNAVKNDFIMNPIILGIVFCVVGCTVCSWYIYIAPFHNAVAYPILVVYLGFVVWIINRILGWSPISQVNAGGIFMKLRALRTKRGKRKGLDHVSPGSGDFEGGDHGLHEHWGDLLQVYVKRAEYATEQREKRASKAAMSAIAGSV